jgi:hypothetical protein
MGAQAFDARQLTIPLEKRSRLGKNGSNHTGNVGLAVCEFELFGRNVRFVWDSVTATYSALQPEQWSNTLG